MQDCRHALLIAGWAHGNDAPKYRHLVSIIDKKEGAGQGCDRVDLPKTVRWMPRQIRPASRVT
jgi:hypothetical protein